MEGIDYLNDPLLTVSSKNDPFEISFFTDRPALRAIEDFVQFIKGCEWTVRKMNEYKQFKAQLVEEGLDRCQILGHVSSDGSDGVDIEMHHGPLLTLFDYCAIVTDALLNRGETVDTFTVARLVMNEHWADHVQVVMLTKTAHQLVDTGKIFIHFNQAKGNVNEFLKAYGDGLTPDRIEKINRYIDLCSEFDTFDNHLLEVKDTITDWNYDVARQRVKK